MPVVVWPADPVLVHVGRFTPREGPRDVCCRRSHDSPPSTGDRWCLSATARTKRESRAMNHRARPRRRMSLFTGFTRNPYRYLARATISVLTSPVRGPAKRADRIDGVGISIVVSTACQFSPLEVLGNNEMRRTDAGRRSRRVRGSRRGAARRSWETSETLAARRAAQLISIGDVSVRRAGSARQRQIPATPQYDNCRVSVDDARICRGSPAIVA